MAVAVADLVRSVAARGEEDSASRCQFSRKRRHHQQLPLYHRKVILTTTTTTTTSRDKLEEDRQSPVKVFGTTYDTL